MRLMAIRNGPNLIIFASGGLETVTTLVLHEFKSEISHRLKRGAKHFQQIMLAYSFLNCEADSIRNEPKLTIFASGGLGR